MSRHKESRKRNLSFHLPAAVACSPSVRLYQTDSSYISLGEIYDLHCEETGIPREEPILFVGEKIRKVLREYRQQTGKMQVGTQFWPFLQSFIYITQPTKVEYVTLKKDTCDETSAKMVPDNVLSKVDIIRFFPHEFSLSVFSI